MPRFGGEKFPPRVFFKVYLSSRGAKVVYMSGKKMIRPASQVRMQNHSTPDTHTHTHTHARAHTHTHTRTHTHTHTHTHKASKDALKHMGARKMLDQMYVDMATRTHGGLMDELDVVTKREYMQLKSHVDKQSAAFGGRDNDWRSLREIDRPVHGIVQDFVEFVNSNGAEAADFIKYVLESSSTVSFACSLAVDL